MKEKRLVKKTVYHVTVLVVGIAMIYSLIWIVMSSFKGNGTIFSTAGSLIPENFILNNYSMGRKDFGKISFVTFLQNSIFISVMATLGAMASSALVAYGFARFRFRDCGILFATTPLSTVLPAQVFMISQYLWCQKLGWVGSYTPLAVPHFFAIQGFFVHLISNFISGIPIKLDETAKIGGCSYAHIFTYIMLPLTKPVLVTACISSFMWRWDDFLSVLLYVSKPSMYPASFVSKSSYGPGPSSDYDAMFAMATLSILPSVLIFLFFQKYLVEDISTSSLKG